MISPPSLHFALCTLVGSLCFNALTTAQQCYNSTTAIHGKPFPPLVEATTEDLITGLESGLFTSVDLVNAYQARIFEVNDTLHMVTQLNPDALIIAAEADALRANGTVLGPLHGIPIMIKNNIATFDKMDNTAGSYALAGAKVPRDSTIAAKLRKAGAVILGKSNLSQWANYRSFNTSNGWSAIAGQTKGAYYLDQDPSGSSSGSGVCSSLGLALSSLGTETSGSIISPSDANNLVGIKPTVGLTARDLVIPISSHQDTVGPMTRTVKDAAYLLSAIAGYSPYDNYTSAIPFNTIPDYVAACRYDALKGKRVGIPRNVLDGAPPGTEPILNAFEAIIPLLKSAGAIIVDNANFTGLDDLNNSTYETVILEADFITDLPGEYLSKLTYNPQNINNVAQLTNFTHANPLEDWPGRDTEIWEEALSLGFDNTSPEFWGNYTAGRYLAGPLGVTGALKNYSLDALILPTEFAPSIPAIIGTPLITVPLGKYPEDTPVVQNRFGNLNATYPGAPFGLSFLGDYWSEETLIGLAYAFEQRTKVRDTIVPYIQPVTELVDVVQRRRMSVRLS